MTLKITQAAREAAADLIECLAGGKTASSVKMRIAAADDYPEVQAFQRAMNQAADEALERAAEWMEDGLDQDAEDLCTRVFEICREQRHAGIFTGQPFMDAFAASIRALKGQQP